MFSPYEISIAAVSLYYQINHLMENVHFEKENQVLSTTYTVITSILFFGLMILGCVFVYEAIALLNAAQVK